MKELKIGKDKVIGSDHPCFIIAEAGVNHNGDINLARQLIDAAIEVGADAVKFQTFKAEKLVTSQAAQAEYQVENLGEKTSQLKMLKRLELSYNDFKVLKNYAKEKNIIFLSTPFDDESADFLFELGLEIFKIGSGDLTNLPFLKKVSGYKKPIILSTGMGTLDEVRTAVDTIISINPDLILLHCVTNYPVSPADANLRAIKTLQKEFALITGYSDHTTGILAPVAAVSLGAKVIEKHFTMDRDLPGPDQKASLEPSGFREMINSIRVTETLLGNGKKEPSELEKGIRDSIRKSLVAGLDLAKGHVLKEEDIVIKRPGTGISPADIDKVVGLKIKERILKDELIIWDKLEKKEEL